MTAIEQHQLGKTLWAIADDLRGAMNADDFWDRYKANKADVIDFDSRPIVSKTL